MSNCAILFLQSLSCFPSSLPYVIAQLTCQAHHLDLGVFVYYEGPSTLTCAVK